MLYSVYGYIVGKNIKYTDSNKHKIQDSQFSGKRGKWNLQQVNLVYKILFLICTQVLHFLCVSQIPH